MSVDPNTETRPRLLCWLPAVKCSRPKCSRRIIADRHDRCEVCRAKARAYKALKS